MSGRAVDKQVLEAVGWTALCIEPIVNTSSGSIHHALSGRNPDGSYYANAPYPSTDIAAAIGALEEFCEQHDKGWEITKFRNPKDGVICTILSFVQEDTPISEPFDVVSGWTIAKGDTIPAAICGAILATHEKGGSR